MKGLAIFIAITAELVAIVAGDLGYLFDSSYGAKAEPEPWNLRYSSFNGNKKQSPIKIDTRRVNPLDPNLPDLELHHYNKKYTFEMQNNGHTVNAKISSENANSVENENCETSNAMEFEMPFITCGPLAEDNYKLNSLHFHWSNTNKRGAEHKIDNESSPLEIHFVHQNVRYNDSEALKHSDGLAVVAALFKISDVNGEELEPITSNLQNILEFNSRTLIPPTTIQKLLGGHILDMKYYTYKGSLTTPPYAEVVTWIVLSKPLDVSKIQLNEFRSIKQSNGENLAENQRELQKRNGRLVYCAKTSSICYS